MASSVRKLLFTPGPLSVSLRVKEAMLSDWGSRDVDFIRVIKEIREKLLVVAGVPALGDKAYTTVLLQGSGTYAVEAVLSCAVPQQGKILTITNGAYGNRMVKMLQRYKIPHIQLDFPENKLPVLEQIQSQLEANKDLTHVAVVHSETTSGLINPIHDIGKLIQKVSPNVEYIVDAMSSFGGVPIDPVGAGIHYLVSSANKCLQGVPGFTYVIANKQALNKTKGQSRTLVLDLFEQNEGLDKTGQFRFTPPTHTLLAFREALTEFDEEGGISARAARYRTNNELAKRGFQRLHFSMFLPDELQGPIITSWVYPVTSDGKVHPKWNFDEFYQKLHAKGNVLYPGKVTHAESFRIGNIGDLHPQDFIKLVRDAADTLVDMGIATASDVAWAQNDDWTKKN